MRVTYPEAYFNFVDVTAQDDSRPASTSAKTFSDLTLFREMTQQDSYGTLELNQFILDGSRTVIPETMPSDVPFWSDEISNAEGNYAKAPALEIAFSRVHSSIGLTLYFSGDVPAELCVTWYTLYGTKLCSEIFYPDANEFVCRRQVENYGKIVIAFTKSSFPYRYIKLDHIRYGQMWHLGRDKIKTASILEELDPTSATLSINTANVELVDAAGEFDTAKESGLWKSLQKDQPIAFMEYVNGIPVDCGTFYLSSWSGQKNLIKFNFVDPIGMMDKTQYYGGQVYDGISAGDIIAEIMKSCGVQYEIAEDVAVTRLSGWLAVQSHRAALQQVVFACGAVADCSRSDKVRIYRQNRYASRTIGINRKFSGTRITLNDYVSSVTVSYNQYIKSNTVKQISKSTLARGQTKIEFKTPYQELTLAVSAGKICEAATNYVVVEMPEEGECVISGRPYDTVENAYTARVPTLAAGETEKEKTYKGCTMTDAGSAKAVAEAILEYHQLRQEVSMRYINDGEGVGNWCELGITGGKSVMTCITSQTIDLTGGNLATAKCRGYYNSVTIVNYCTDSLPELYAGEEAIL